MADARRCPKVIVLQTHPIQYQTPLFRALTEQGRVQLKVFFLSDAGARAHFDPGFGQSVSWDLPMFDGYASTVFQPGSTIVDRSFYQRFDPALFKTLREEKPDWILVFGHNSLQHWGAVYWAALSGARVMFMSDSNIRLHPKTWKFLAKQMLLPAFYRRIDAFLCPSDANRAYLLAFGARPEAIHSVPFAINTAPFRVLEPQGEVDFVWVAKFIPLKRPQDFVAALAILHQRGLQPRASMVGDGPLFQDTQQLAKQSLPEGCLRFRGFVNQSQMPHEFARGRVFVFTSERDAYGLAVTEAAATGLAILSADINGCVGKDSIVQDGRNAFTYPAGNVTALADAMQRYLLDPQLLADHQHESRRIALSHDVHIVAAKIAQIMGA